MVNFVLIKIKRQIKTHLLWSFHFEFGAVTVDPQSSGPSCSKAD